jgi:hypothetical protein
LFDRRNEQADDTGRDARQELIAEIARRIEASKRREQTIARPPRLLLVLAS